MCGQCFLWKAIQRVLWQTRRQLITHPLTLLSAVFYELKTHLCWALRTWNEESVYCIFSSWCCADVRKYFYSATASDNCFNESLSNQDLLYRQHKHLAVHTCASLTIKVLILMHQYLESAVSVQNITHVKWLTLSVVSSGLDCSLQHHIVTWIFLNTIFVNSLLYLLINCRGWLKILVVYICIK